MINIVIPMAGAGSRFAKAGYENPKPFIDIMGKPMIQWVIENLATKIEHKFIFICQKEHQEKYQFDSALQGLSPGSQVIGIDHLTQGAAETVLFATELIDNSDSLVIANSDQFVEFDLQNFFRSLDSKISDGCILTMTSSDAKWSYIKYDTNCQVTEVREKEVISDEATVGIYGFAKGSDFVRGAKNMIDNDSRVNGEFYVAPVYNELIRDGGRISFENIGSDKEQMNGLGTPEDLLLFLRKIQS
jgi:NDP-sugar pyrophosphorylase family protein